MKWKYKGIYLLAFLLIGLLLAGCSASGDNKVATVNGQNITADELDRQVQLIKASYEQHQMEWNEEEMQTLILEHMIDQTLLRQEAEKDGMAPSDAEVQENIETVKGQFPSEEEFNQVLEYQNMSVADLKVDIYNEISVNRYLDENIESQDIVVSDQEVIDYYEQFKASVEAQGQDQVVSIEEVRPQIEEMLIAEKLEVATSAIIQELRANGEIETFI